MTTKDDVAPCSECGKEFKQKWYGQDFCTVRCNVQQAERRAYQRGLVEGTQVTARDIHYIVCKDSTCMVDEAYTVMCNLAARIRQDYGVEEIE
jgi:hypothetical protein